MALVVVAGAGAGAGVSVNMLALLLALAQPVIIFLQLRVTASQMMTMHVASDTTRGWRSLCQGPPQPSHLHQSTTATLFAEVRK